MTQLSPDLMDIVQKYAGLILGKIDFSAQEFGRTVRLLRARTSEELAGIERILEIKKDEACAEADYCRASEYRNVLTSYRQDVLLKDS